MAQVRFVHWIYRGADDTLPQQIIKCSRWKETLGTDKEPSQPRTSGQSFEKSEEANAILNAILAARG